MNEEQVNAWVRVAEEESHSLCDIMKNDDVRPFVLIIGARSDSPGGGSLTFSSRDVRATKRDAVWMAKSLKMQLALLTNAFCLSEEDLSMERTSMIHKGSDTGTRK